MIVGNVERFDESRHVFARNRALIPGSDPYKAFYQKHPELEGIELSSEEASIRVKGFAKSIGAALVGITEINPLWVFSHKGEIFYENWEDWGKRPKARPAPKWAQFKAFNT